ncbi:MAG: Tetraacyldisaccharide 4-kinase [Planctomycetota bacterium]
MSAGVSSLRQALWPLGLLYGTVAAARNLAFDVGIKKTHRLAATVVSVGNLAVGGTGKTPTVAWLCELARAAGRRPGVLARGYGRTPGAELNDEGLMLQRRLPWLLQEQRPDRVAAGARLLARGADYVVLDDGFQHRRLHRDLDLVCLDATLPFGNGQCLPSGDLREWRSGLRRAGLVLLTRASGLSPEALAQRVRRLREIARKPELAVYATEHAPLDLVLQPSGEQRPVAELRRRRVVLLSAIARPASFRSTCEALGADVVGELAHRDHHTFTAAELERAVATARAADAMLLTTEKDDARIGEGGPERAVLRIGLRFFGPEPTAKELLL